MNTLQWVGTTIDGFFFFEYKHTQVSVSKSPLAQIIVSFPDIRVFVAITSGTRIYPYTTLSPFLFTLGSCLFNWE